MMLDPFLEQLNHWDWWIFATVLIILEVYAPSAVFLWLGVAAGGVGGVVFVLPDISWENQVLVFALLSVVSVLVGRRYFRWRPIATDHPFLNRRGEQYVGRSAILVKSIEHGKGAIRLDDSTWSVTGPDLPEGASVKIVGAEGTILLVEEDK
jgi:membrane protein implicated in regulation of membrane protease activity